MSNYITVMGNTEQCTHRRRIDYRDATSGESTGFG